MGACKKVLLVDSLEKRKRFTAAFLRYTFGWSVDESSSAAAAVGAYELSPVYDIIFLRVEMECDIGLKAAVSLFRSFQYTKRPSIFAIAGDSVDSSEASSVGFDGVLLLPGIGA